jgi:Zn-dependent peptidase ImmA (M78 family)
MENRCINQGYLNRDNLDIYSEDIKDIKNLRYIISDLKELTNQNFDSLDLLKIANNLGMKVYLEKFNSCNGDTVSGVILNENNVVKILLNKDDSVIDYRFNIARMIGWSVLYNNDLNTSEKIFMRIKDGLHTTNKKCINVNNFALELLINDSKFYDYLSGLLNVYNQSNIIKSINNHILVRYIIKFLADKFEVSNSLIEYKLSRDGHWNF